MIRALKWLSIVVGLAASVTFNSSFAEDIQVGISTPLTGPLASTGNELKMGVQLYFDSVNDNGGVFGRKLKLVPKDDGYKIPDTVKNIKELAANDHIVALIGSAGTAHLGEVLKQKVLKDAGIIMMSPYTGATSLRLPFDYTRNIFHIRASYDDEAEGIVDQLIALQLDKIAVFYQGDAFGKAGYDGVAAALKRRGKTIVSSGTYKSADPTNVAEAVKDIVKGDPSAVVMWAINPATAAFVKASKPISRIAQYVNLSVVNPKYIYEHAGEKFARGVGISQVMPFPYAMSAPIVKEYLEALKKYGPKGAEVGYASLEEFIGAKALVEGMRRGGKNITRESIFKGLETMNDFDVGGFKVRFSSTNHAQSTFEEVTVISKNGTLIR